MFPRLAERRGNLGSQLSGGEQQMLAIGRALILNPQASSCSTSRSRGWRRSSSRSCSACCATCIRDEGMSAIVVEQKARKILGFTDRAIVLDRGRIVLASDSQSLANDPAQLETHLGVTEQKRPFEQAAELKIFLTRLKSRSAAPSAELVEARHCRHYSPFDRLRAEAGLCFHINRKDP